MFTHEDIAREVQRTVADVKSTTPLVGSITNVITIDFVANAQLAAGGSAAMGYLGEEGEALAQAGRAFYINMGSLLPVHEEGVIRTAAAAHAKDTPWVLDPVGIGIGTMRTELLEALKEHKPSIIRCNASESIALAQVWGQDPDGISGSVKGVDSTDSVDAARVAATSLARCTGGAVAVSGEVDFITDGELCALSTGGSPLMGKVTGFGCSLGGVAAVYAAAGAPFIAALAAANAYNLAASRAETISGGPASFKLAFIDALYNATPEDIASNPFTLEEV